MAAFCYLNFLLRSQLRFVAMKDRRSLQYATLAQLVEQRYRKPWVAGSNPAGGSTRLLSH